MATKKAVQRSLFHRVGGGIDFSRLTEQMIPTILMGLVVIYANSKVTEYQIADIRKDMVRAEASDVQKQAWLQAQSEKLAGISAQMAGFLAQQTQLNAAMDARLTYVERAQANRVTVIEPASPERRTR